MIDQKELETRFSWHTPKPELNQPTRYEAIRAAGKVFARLLNAECPDSREKSLAITKLEEAVMWANAAIARRE